MESCTVGSLLVRSRPTTVVVTPTLLKLCPIKYHLVLLIMSWLIVIQEKDIRENTCYIYHNYVIYLSLRCDDGVRHEETILHHSKIKLQIGISYSITLICFNGQSLCLP